MSEPKKTQEKPEVMGQECAINFAFCPNAALTARGAITEELHSSLKEKIKNKSLTDDDYKTVSDATRFFYICYCLSFENMQDYFYFQTFSKIADSEIIQSKPLYGFYKKEDIIKLVSSIDDCFHPNTHDKQIFDNITIDSSFPASVVMNLMTAWTETKLLQFSEFCHSDEKIQKSLLKVTTALNKMKPAKKKTTRKKVVKKIVKKKPNETRGSAKNKPIDKPERKRKGKEKPND